MCIRDSDGTVKVLVEGVQRANTRTVSETNDYFVGEVVPVPVSYTHLRAHETVLDLVCRLLLEKTKLYNRQCRRRTNIDKQKQHTYTRVVYNTLTPA